MIITVKSNSDNKQFDNLTSWIKKLGLDIHISKGDTMTIIGLIGDTSRVDKDLLMSLDIVENVQRVSEPYKNVNRKFKPENSLVDVDGKIFGGVDFQVIAGPCSVESEEQVISIAKSVKESGATLLRGGAFKPRSSPYSFQGLGVDGLKMLLKAKKEVGLPIVSELMTQKYIDDFVDVDVIQIGARNMQNFDLLKEVGKLNKPILLKRGLANTIEEWLMSAEYIMSEGNKNVILCERGIRTFETATRNTLDISAIPVLKEKTHLPIIVDPSHASGISRLVKPLALASAAAGADGVLIEVHNCPECALCDGAQSLNPIQFSDVMVNLKKIMPIVERRL